MRTKVTVSSKGQLTLPVSVRRDKRVGDSRVFHVEVNDDGSITLRPPPSVEKLAGSLRLRERGFGPKSWAEIRAAVRKARVQELTREGR